MDLTQYIGMFTEESRENLQILNKGLLELEADPSNTQVLDEIFRSAHTLKGMSATMGFSVIAELTHEMEDVLDLLRKGLKKCDEKTVEVLFACVDTLEKLVEEVVKGEEHADITLLLNDLKALLKEPALAGKENLHEEINNKEIIDKEKAVTEVPETKPIISLELSELEKSVIANAEQQSIAAFHIQVELDHNCILKAARVYMVMTTLEDFGEVIKVVPSTEDLEKENFANTFELVLLTTKDEDEIKKRLLSISEIVKVILRRLSEAVPKEVKKESPTVDLSQKKPELQEFSEEKSSLAETKKLEEPKRKNVQSVRVDIDKLDNLLNIVGEIVINKTRLLQIGSDHKLPDLIETMEQMDRITTELQAIVMKIRMVPVGQVFNRFPRMIRDLSKELGKEINLVIEGEETELDRTVIDEIGDPLMHILRNSLDHGIESLAERIELGKDPIGEVCLVASHEGNNVVIEIKDDGRGINHDLIKQKAVEKGVLSQAEAELMEESETIKLIFTPGFSTTDTITDISGRGVGMDVVRTKIENLGGSVDVETKLGAGSRFKIRLPLTLAIIQALLVKVSEETFAIPLGCIDSTINLHPSDISKVQNKEVFLLRGQIIPIIRLDNALAVPKGAIIQAEDTQEDELYVVIVQMGDQKAGIIVDALIGQHDIVIKTLGKLMSNINVIAGATVLGDGNVALILDIGTLLNTP